LQRLDAKVALPSANRIDIRGFLQQQQLYVFVGVALFAVISALRLSTHLWTVLVFSLCIGNLTVPIMSRFERYYSRLAFPFNWLVYLPLLALVGLGSAIVATAVVYWLLLPPSTRTEEKIFTDIRFGALITVIIGIVYYIYRNMRATLETQNVKLQQAVRTGEARLELQEKELETAREIQAGLIPKQIPQSGDLQIAASWEPARAVGGDYFDVIKLDDQRVAICIADVVGKGIAAALLMANVQAAVRAFATDHALPSEICDRLNHVLCSNLAPGKFVTFLCCIVDAKAGTLTYSNAGHCFPLLAHSAGKVAVCAEGGLVLGVVPESRYVDSVVSLEPGDKLLLFTDGIFEATNSMGEEFGEARLRKALSALVYSDIEAVHSKLMQEVSLFCGGNFADDATLVLLSYKQARSGRPELS
jgi:phosphoserine phosphatase RsbU/P